MRERHQPIFNNQTKRSAYVFSDDGKNWNVTLGFIQSMVKRPTIMGLPKDNAIEKAKRWVDGETQAGVVLS